METIGVIIEQNVNAEIMLIIASIVLLPAVLIGMARYVKFIITGNDFKCFQKR